MCKSCSQMLTFADIYNSAFAARDRSQWTEDQLRKTEHMCMTRRMRILRLIEIAVGTQSIFDRPLTPRDKPLAAVRVSKERFKRIKTMRTRRLVRQMLKHSYRPGGRMFMRLLAEHQACGVDAVHRANI